MRHPDVLDITNHVADEDSDGDTYQHLLDCHRLDLYDSGEDPVTAHALEHGMDIIEG